MDTRPRSGRGLTLGSTLAALGLALGSITAAAPASAALAAPAAVQPAPAAPATAPAAVQPAASKTISTNFRWADGSTVKATVVRGSGATEIPKSAFGKRTVAWEKWDFMIGVLSDGRAVGLKGGKLYYSTTAGALKSFNTGWTPSVDYAFLQGNHAYGMRFSGTGSQFFDLGVLGGKINQNAPWLAGEWAGGSVAVTGGRVYWERVVLSKGLPVRNEVVSRSLKGGAVRLEGKNLGNPTLVDGGIAVVTHTARKGDWSGGPVTGARMLSGKKLIGYSGTWPTHVGGSSGPAVLQLGGHTIAVGNENGAGATIIDTKAKKAWWVSAPGRSTAGVLTLAGNRVVWPWEDFAHYSAKENRTLAVFQGGSLRKITANSTLMGSAANGSAIAYGTWSSASSRTSFASSTVK